jgi:hypothetical protein
MESERDNYIGRHVIDIPSCIGRRWEINHGHGNGDQFQRIDTGDKQFRWSGHGHGFRNNIHAASPLLPVADGK